MTKQMLITAAVCLPFLIYITLMAGRSAVVGAIRKKCRAAAICVSLLPAAGFTVYFFFRPINSAAVLLHLSLISMAFELVGLIMRAITKRRAGFRVEGVFAVVCTAVLLVFGTVSASGLTRTAYIVTSDKIASPMRVAQISDVHIGAVFDADGFSRRLGEIQRDKPDLLVVTGDLFDGYSDVGEIKKACAALGGFEAKYGVFFVFGNHDVGTPFGKSKLSVEDFVKELEKNGVTVLADEVRELENGVYAIGRKDRIQSGRADIASLVSECGSGGFKLIFDHQPNDQRAEAEAGADLVLSGHTHGGQFFPLGLIGERSGMNEMSYGIRRSGETVFIVTSGISDWATTFRTGCFSEYVIVDILPR